MRYFAFRLVSAAIVCFVLCALASGDTLVFKSGGSLECEVLKETGSTLVVRVGSGVMTVDRALVAEVKKNHAIKHEDPDRKPIDWMPAWSSVVDTVGKTPWVADLHEVPATVIDVGILKHVPYRSFRFSKHYEVNVYGDPARPAGVEIGACGPLADDLQARRRCVELAESMFRSSGVLSRIRELRMSPGAVSEAGTTVEVTPPEAPDAYGGWWISVYRETELDTSRATPEEMQSISTPLIVDAGKADSEAKRGASKGALPSRASDPDHIRDATSRQDRVDEAVLEWQVSDYKHARRARPEAGERRVYVRGYYRKDGTYVRPHSRKR